MSYLRLPLYARMVDGKMIDPASQELLPLAHGVQGVLSHTHSPLVLTAILEGKEADLVSSILQIKNSGFKDHHGLI